MDQTTFEKTLQDHGYNETATVEMEAGAVLDTHTHDFDAMLLVLSGGITVTTEQATTTCASGDTFSLASGTPHSEVVGDEGVCFLVGRKYTAAV